MAWAWTTPLVLAVVFGVAAASTMGSGRALAHELPERLINAGAPGDSAASAPLLDDDWWNAIVERAPGARASAQVSFERSLSTPRWREVPPPTRAQHSMVYDSRRHRLLVFGGTEGPGDDTWEVSLTGEAQWRIVPTSGELPPPLYGHTAVYDPVDDRMIVFGGGGGSRLPFQSEVWILSLASPATWSRLSVTGRTPQPRRSHGAILDPDRRRMVIHGGLTTFDSQNPAYLDDTWALELGHGAPRWKQLHSVGTGPGPRSAHATIHDPVRDAMVVFGGTAVGASPPYRLSSIWSMSLRPPYQWTELSPPGAGPNARDGLVGLFDPLAERMIVHAGHGALGGDTWSFSLREGTWRPIAQAEPTPAGRQLHAVAYDPVGHRLITHGGVGDFAFLRDAWALDLHADLWSPLTPADAGPPLLMQQACAHDPVRNRMILYGGWNGGYSNDVWALDLDDLKTWTRLHSGLGGPDPRTLPAITYDSAADRILMFGGRDQFRTLNDLWSFGLGGASSWQRLIPGPLLPPGASGHALVLDPLRNRLIAYGDETGLDQRVWICRLGAAPSWSSVQPSGPSPGQRYSYSAFYDQRRDRVVFYGGWSHGRRSGDVWALRMLDMRWELLAPEEAGPGGENSYAAIHDAEEDRLIVWGGYDAYFEGDARTWSFSLGEHRWEQVETVGTPPVPRPHATAVFDQPNQRMLIFGGMTFGGLWALEWGPALENREVTRVSAEQISAAPTRVYPNPASSVLHVRAGSHWPASSSLIAELFDLSGRRVAHTGRFSGSAMQPVADLPPGLYLLRISDGRATESHRVVITGR